MFSFDSCTFGWSNGLIPSTQPATAVAYSQSRNCAPSGPDDRGDRVRRRPRPGEPEQHQGDVRRRWCRARSAPSTTTGSMPVPCLPVDSAISCSAQSPKPTMPEPASAITSLSRPWSWRRPARGRGPEPGCARSRPARPEAPRRRPAARLHVGAGERRRARARTRTARCSARRRSGSARTTSRKPAPLAVGLQRRARVGDHDDAPADLVLRHAGRRGRPARTPAGGCRSPRCCRSWS